MGQNQNSKSRKFWNRTLASSTRTCIHLTLFYIQIIFFLLAIFHLLFFREQISDRRPQLQRQWLRKLICDTVAKSIREMKPKWRRPNDKLTLIGIRRSCWSVSDAGRNVLVHHCNPHVFKVHFHLSSSFSGMKEKPSGWKLKSEKKVRIDFLMNETKYLHSHFSLTNFYVQ
jgi:hypothetical protein